MNGVTFGDYHSWNDFQLILSRKTIGTATPKTDIIEIPGGDGVLDLTQFFGETKYNSRTLTFEFSVIAPRTEFMTLFARVQHELHGRKMKIALDEDPEWYYIGRIDVSEWTEEKNVGRFTIECDCEPFRYRLSSQAVNLSGRNLLNLDDGTATTEGAWTKNDTGYTFTRGAESGGSFLYWNIPVKKGQQYIFSASNTSTTRMLYVYSDKLYGNLIVKEQNERPCIFTAEKAGLYVFGLYVTSQATAGDFLNVMLQEGNTAGEYVAYDATEKTQAVTFSNARKTAIPTVYVNGAIEVTTPSTAQVLTPGATTLTLFPFYEGENTLTFTGHGNAVVEWKERGL